MWCPIEEEALSAAFKDDRVNSTLSEHAPEGEMVCTLLTLLTADCSPTRSPPTKSTYDSRHDGNAEFEASSNFPLMRGEWQVFVQDESGIRTATT